MNVELWYLFLGALLIAIALVSSLFRHLPATTTMLYLAMGVALGPVGAGVAIINPIQQAPLLERLAELSVIVSLFTAGLKLRIPLRHRDWIAPFRLATISMVFTVGLVAVIGVFVMDLPPGVAILLGGILAPTDPVLASEVQLESAADRDKLRFSITGEAGMNDGTAFPFVVLGLGLLGLHDLGAHAWRWITIDIVWGITVGLAIGTIFGGAVARMVIYLRRKHKEGFGRDEFLALGLIAASYGAAVLTHSYGFLAVFAAGLALRAVERQYTGPHPIRELAAFIPIGRAEEIATHRRTAPAHMAEAVLAFNSQLESILEVALVLLVGAMLAPEFLRTADLRFVPVLLLVIRPVSVCLGLLGLSVEPRQLAFMSWFGIRGIGSLYYLSFVINHGVHPEYVERLVSLTLWTVAASIVLHGISVMPLMKWYQARR
jgi:NhaP-type Na+/H+ or K+/H+ antiporter